MEELILLISIALLGGIILFGMLISLMYNVHRYGRMETEEIVNVSCFKSVVEKSEYILEIQQAKINQYKD